MIRLAIAVVAAAGLALAIPADAGEFNKKLSIGDAAPSWNDLPGVDGKKHSLTDLKDKDVVVMVITTNHCPVAVAYEDRIINFCKQNCAADSKVALVAINVNNSEADKLPKMVERSQEKGFNFPYLYDASQKIGREYGATVTPEFFVLNKERKVTYMGSLDDSQTKPKVNFLEAAVLATLKGGKPAKAETRGFGCGIQYERAAK